MAGFGTNLNRLDRGYHVCGVDIYMFIDGVLRLDHHSVMMRRHAHDQSMMLQRRCREREDVEHEESADIRGHCYPY